MFDFSKIYSAPVNTDFILSKVADSVIFYQYFGPFELGKVYKSKFRKDRNPSTGFYVNKLGRLIYNDITTGEKLDCFAFVAKLYNISYSDAIKKIGNDFGIIGDSKQSIVSAATFKAASEIDKDCKQKTIIQVKPNRWKEENLAYWREFEISQKELEENDVYPIGDLYINKQKIYNPHNYLRYAYRLKYNGEEFIKIYSPHDTKMKWVSNIPLYIPFGLDTLPQSGDKLIVTKSQKDRIVLKKLFPAVIASQNESESALSSEIQEIIKNNHDFKRKIIFWDNDPTGVEACKKFNEKGFGYFNIPKECYEKFKIKDASDYVAYYGIDALADLLKEKNIL